MALRSRRLEMLLGGRLDALSGDAICGLVDVGAQEAFDLDFKLNNYGRSDAEKRSLAGDVAALANTAGGIIVLGIDEDDQARATVAAGVEVSDAEVGRIRQVVASLVAPLPVFDVLTLADDRPSVARESATKDGEDGRSHQHGFVIIAVPRSPNAPHAVLVNDALRFPKRNGATTRYLSEPEVAVAYRDRLAGMTRQVERIKETEQEALTRLDRKQPWLLVSLVPDHPGDLVITTAAFVEFQRTTVGTPSAIARSGSSFSRASVGRRRLLADSTLDNSPLAREASLELHTDGAGAYALQLRDLSLNHRRDADGDGAVQQIVNDGTIAIAALSGLLYLAQHARDRAAAGGSVVVRVTLAPSIEAQSIAIGSLRHGWPESRSRVAIGGDLVTAEAVRPLDELASPGSALVATAAELIDEVGQAFGIPELGQLSRDGKVRRQCWGPDWSPRSCSGSNSTASQSLMTRCSHSPVSPLRRSAPIATNIIGRMPWTGRV